MNVESRSDEITIEEIVGGLKRYKWLLLLTPLITGVIAALWVSFVLKPTWEASVTLDFGRIWQEGKEAVPVESVANASMRMKSTSFAKNVLESAGLSPDELGVAGGDLSSIQVVNVKDSGWVAVSLRAHSPELANKLIGSCVVNLQKVHQSVMAASINRLNLQKTILDNSVKETDYEVARLKQKLLASHDWNAFDATLAATVLRDKTAELRDLHQRRLALEEQLHPERTYNTRVFGDISVSNGPVSPRKRMIIGVAILIGLFGAMVIAFVHNLIKRPSYPPAL